MFRRFTKTRIAVVLGAVAALAVAMGAYAYFTAEGKGTGSAETGSAAEWHVTSKTTAGQMYPGVATSDQTVTVTIKNQGGGYQKLHSFTIEVAEGNGTAWTSQSNTKEEACSANDFTLGGQSAAGAYTGTVEEDLAPGAERTAEVNLHMLDTGEPQDNCQGQKVPLYITAK